MDDQIIRAYLWQDVIRLGFCPVGIKAQKTWLHQYHCSLQEFWEVDYCPATPRQMDNTINAVLDCVNMLNLYLEYAIKSDNSFIVRFLYSPPLNSKELMWIHDVDGNFFTFPAKLFLDHHQRKVVVRGLAVNDNNIAAVVDSLILHPAAHQHIESPIGEHQIRIGGGIDNPFLYLFHLRYQLCPIREKKEAERARLINLFYNAIKNRSKFPIPANDLLAQPSI